MSYDPEQLLQDHRATWHSFIRLVIWSSGAVIVLLILMAIFLL